MKMKNGQFYTFEEDFVCDLCLSDVIDLLKNSLS